MVQAKSKTGKRLAREAAERAAKFQEIPEKTPRKGSHFNPKLHIKGTKIRLHPLRDGLIPVERSVTRTWKAPRGLGSEAVSPTKTVAIARYYVHQNPETGNWHECDTGKIVRTESMGENPLPNVAAYSEGRDARPTRQRAPRVAKPVREKVDKPRRAGKSVKLETRTVADIVGTGPKGGITKDDCDSLIRVMYAKQNGGSTTGMPRINAAMRAEAKKMLVKMRKKASK